MKAFITHTGQSHGLAGDDLLQFIERPDWVLVEKYIDSVLEVTRPTTEKTIFRLPE